MLEHLHVSNLGVLEDVSIDPSPGLTVITGETGAGKTLLLGGLRLILGDKTDSSTVGPVAESAQVDGLFVVDGLELGVSRSVPRDGRSRAHLEGAIVSAAALGERVAPLVEIVGQHDQLSITRPGHLLTLLDGALDSDGKAAWERYRDAWERYQDALHRQEQLGGDPIALTRELDLARYQAMEIAAAGLEEGLDEDLEAQVSRLRNVEEIKAHLAETIGITEQMAEQAGELVSHMRKVGNLDPTVSDLTAHADGIAEAVSLLSREARLAVEGLEMDPELLAELEDRLTAIGELKRKYGRTLADVMEYGELAADRVSELENLVDDADDIESLVMETRETARTAAGRLSRQREQLAAEVAKAVMGHLTDLALGSASVEVVVATNDLGPTGVDRVEMLFASDSRLTPAPIANVASGGELSRLVLALRLATQSVTAETLVFDEVDTGIGGRTALAMGEKLAALARESQVLCVTHLPQVAAHADTHYVVERGPDGAAHARQVEGEERVTEITRMLAGLPDSRAGRSAASELLSGAAK
jgi:DNA repair protein RecN (Recombination protein N)